MIEGRARARMGDVRPADRPGDAMHFCFIDYYIARHLPPVSGGDRSHTVFLHGQELSLEPEVGAGPGWRRAVSGEAVEAARATLRG